MPRTVIAIAVLTVVALLLLANAYGFHRDELYFVVAGQHPSWGYDDQPPLTPILCALGVAVFGTSPIAVRVLPALVAGACVALAAAMTREMGGTRRAQEAAAIAVAFSGAFFVGHLASTATYDVLAWVVISWLVIRILRGADARGWLIVGVVVGVGLMNKYTLALFGVTIVVGILIERRWAIFRSPWPWAGAGIALALWAPNLVWQATHGLPQLEMARHIATASGADDRATLIPLQLIFAGPLLWPIAVLGLGRLAFAPDARPWRPFAWAYLLALTLTYAQSGKPYYTAGLIPVLIVAGAVPVGAWLERGRSWLRLAAFAIPAAVSGGLVAVVALPVIPVTLLAASGVNDINKEQGEQVGWPELAASVDKVAAGLSEAERAHAVVITANYGEAGAIQLLGSGSLKVYSGHNSYWYWGPPTDDTRAVIVVGRARIAGLGDCRMESRVDNGYGVQNQEQGAPITVCRQVPSSWSEVWPLYRHLD
ncbi:MAG: glycosyltransferase family 39 protein [Chloroflexota bacterium]|nr:glycosyltransferase family 39 protein [Chloroflexota bacterium]